MIDIDLYQRPHDRNWSGNLIPYQLRSTYAATHSTVYFEVRVHFRRLGDPTWTILTPFPYFPVNGVADVDVAPILNTLLDFDLPPLSGTTPVRASNQVGEFYISYRALENDTAQPWNTEEADFVRMVYKGGIDLYKFRGNNFWLNYFDQGNPFLTWQLSGRKATLQEPLYLGYIINDNLGDDMRMIQVRTEYTDGSNVIQRVGYVNGPKGSLHYIPAGGPAWSLATQQPAQKILYWEVSIIYQQSISQWTTVSGVFRYYAEYMPSESDVVLHFRNSLGCIDSVQIRGEIRQSLDFDYTETESVLLPSYFEGNSFQRVRKISNNREVRTYKGDIGHLGKEAQDRMRDLNVNREVWWLREGKWWPVNLITKNFDLRATSSQRWSMPIEFQLADGGSRYYTPDSVDLGDGQHTSNVCRAFIDATALVVNIAGGTSDITVTPYEIDPDNASAQLRYRLLAWDLATELIPWTTQGYANIHFTVPSSNADWLYLQVQSMCQNAIGGRVRTYQIRGLRQTDPGGCSFVQNMKSVPINVRVEFEGSPVFYQLTVPANSFVAFNAGLQIDKKVKLIVDVPPAFIVASMFGIINLNGSLVGSTWTSTQDVYVMDNLNFFVY